MSARPLPMPINPALLKHADQRRQSLENRDMMRPIVIMPAELMPFMS